MNFVEFLSSPLFFAIAMLILVYIGLIHPYRKKMKERERFLKEGAKSWSACGYKRWDHRRNNQD